MKSFLLCIFLILFSIPVNAGTCKLYLESWGDSQKYFESWDKTLDECINDWWNIPAGLKMSVTRTTREDAYTMDVPVREVEFKFVEEGKRHELSADGTRKLQ
jgi:hypothetical protein